VCCSVLQCVAVCCSVLPCVAVCCSVLQSATDYEGGRFVDATTDESNWYLCCTVLQSVYIMMYIEIYAYIRIFYSWRRRVRGCHNGQKRVGLVLQCATECVYSYIYRDICIHTYIPQVKEAGSWMPQTRNVMQCVAVSCSVLQDVAVCCGLLQLVAVYNRM